MTFSGKRLSILSEPEVKDLYSIPRFCSHEREYFFSLNDEELAAMKRFHTYRNRIHFILMLGYFKVKRVCLVYKWKDIKDDYQYIVKRYFPLASRQNKKLTRQLRSRIYGAVFDILDYQRCNKTTESQLLTHLQARAKIYVDEIQLFRDSINFLKTNQTAIPGYSTLQKIISCAINTEETRLAELITRYLSDKQQFLRLIDSQEKQYRLKDLKKLPKAFKPGENQKELNRYQHLSDLSRDTFNLMNKLKLSQGNIRYFASRCQSYNISDLRELKPEKALIYLTCFTATRFKIANDNLTQAFLVAYNSFYNEAIAYRDEKVKQQAEELLNDMENIPLILNLFTDEAIEDKISFGTVRQHAFNIIPEEQFPVVSQQLAKAKPDKNIFYWEYIDNHFSKASHDIRPLFLALDMGCRNNTVLQRQIQNTKAAIGSNKISLSMDGRLVRKTDSKYLNTTANRNEMYLYKLLHDGVGNGNVYVKNSLEYRSFDDYLVSDRIWHQRHKYLREAGLDWMMQSGNNYLDELECLLNEKISMVGKRISEGKNKYVKRKPNSDKLLWSRAVTPKDTVLTERFFAHFNRTSIVNVLRKVNTETGFMDFLRPESSRNKKGTASIENLLACIIANGTFQGTYNFSRSSNQQYKILKRIEEHYFHEEALHKAIDAITSAAVHLPIVDEFRLSDGEFHGSADGQRFESKYNNTMVDYSAKHFGKKRGSIVYNLVTSHFAANGKVIPPRSHESHHLFDIIYNNSSQLKANVISTDTHGTNLFNHAILNVFGYRFTPRYAHFKKRFLAEFKLNFDKDDMLSLDTPIKWKLIRSEWDNIVKIMLSLSMRTVQQSTLVKKLCSYKKQNATMLALAEFNRVFKCLHLLDYTDDKQLRQVIQESLNRGESLHALKRALAALGGNQFRGHSPEEMNAWNACANLLANAIVYYNALIMLSFKLYCLDKGLHDEIKHLKLISPASWENIILNGFYDLAENDEAWEIEAEMHDLRLAA